MPEKIEITAELIHLNKKNLNGRIYPDNENIREQIKKFNEKKGDSFGQMGFPEADDITIQASHFIRNVRIENDKVIGEITIVDTPYGKVLKEMLDMVVFRSRSIGHTNPDGTVVLDEIVSFDAIPKDDDPFNDDNYEKFQPIMKYNEIYGRIISELDPYGEENWEN